MAVRRWGLPSGREGAAGLGAATGISELVCAVLSARGYSGPNAVKAFFSDEGALESPYAMADMDKAVVRIRQALENGERIAVYGDYDCDGVTATALLTGYLSSVGADVFYYVPNREKEGYGLNMAAVDALRDNRASLIITVDNGISAHEEIAYAKSLGIDTVVTDHHTPRETLPDAVAVVNPRRADCPSRFKELAGVGVAFKLVCALEDAEPAELMEYYSGLAALGTIADVVPLTGENRIIVRHGLLNLKEPESPGIRALMGVSGVSAAKLSSESAAFGLIPRINACGRMGAADDAIELLLTDDNTAAEEAAAHIDAQNIERKGVEDAIMDEALKMLNADPRLLGGRLLMLAGKDWHHGVVGIVASKLMERYGKPTILFALSEGQARGSGRSIPGFSLINAITACNSKLLRYGGHTLAAGLTLREGDLADFVSSMEAYARKNHAVMPVPELRLDCILAPNELTINNIAPLSVLEPFGAGNEQPLFLLPGMRIEGVYPTNDGRHLRLRFRFGNNLFYAVYFRMTAPELPFSAGDTVDAAAAVTVGEWNGAPQLSVRLCDICPHGLDREALVESYSRYRLYKMGEYADTRALVPTREDISAVYRHIRGSGPCFYGGEGIFYRLSRSGADYCRTLIALEVLFELGLIENHGMAIRIKEGAPKADLNQSGILQRLGVEHSF
ncbi:MAG: single-stranded-DNA-specific exonuclease RecJ [Oscillospiraceae bacterium]|nr:single-stranded-DNA-specific exonuclease RecJ [Oscillospiraceae bacterium]